VADDVANSWTVSNRTFARQISWLQRRFELISLSETQRRLRSGFVDRPAVAITFDDGYAENCEHALPLLIQKQVPCTYFVTTQNVLTRTPFPHDAALGRPLTPNTIEQIRKLARAGIEIGAHTRTHADLGHVTDREALYDEIVRGRDELEKLAESRITRFAIPYGQRANFNPEVFNVARDAGFECICTAYGGYNFPGDDAFHLQRVPVNDDMIRLKNWATLDPRKLRIARPDFEICDSAPALSEPIGAGR
jgi:peptidoglycan/xylan/chitin deacetylase (PgdA/CDA1 family)